MTTPRAQLADKLRQARTDAGYSSQHALARALSVSRPVITKAENPDQPVPSEAILTAWAAATGTPYTDLAKLAHDAKSGTPEWFMPWLSAEAAAIMLRYWSPIVAPGITQTPAYMRALFTDEGHHLGQTDELVTARLERQAVIGRIPATLIISHHVLYRAVGSPAVMAEQCAHLAAIADNSAVALHVLPDGVNMGVWGALDIATGDSTVTVRMSGIEDITSTDRNLVRKASLAFDRILGAALPRTTSHDQITEAEEQWKTRT
jgi:transcriptional regulator with XRE-family HTH domain